MTLILIVFVVGFPILNLQSELSTITIPIVILCPIVGEKMTD